VGIPGEYCKARVESGAIHTVPEVTFLSKEERNGAVTNSWSKKTCNYRNREKKGEERVLSQKGRVKEKQSTRQR